MQSKPKRKKYPKYVFQVAFLAPPPEKQRFAIHRPPVPCYTGTLAQWRKFLNSKKGNAQIATWRREIEDGLYQEIVINRFLLQGRLVVPGSSEPTLRLTKNK